MQRANATRNLVLATLAFAVAFVGWSLIAPLAKRFQDDLDLTNTRTLMLTAVPVVLGSLLRIPVGALTDRLGGRVMFPVVLGISAIPAAIFGFVEGYAALIVVGFFLGIAGSSFAVGVPFVAGWYPKERQGFALGVYGMGNIGTAVAAFSAPAIVDWLGREALGIVAAILLVATAVVFYSMAEDPPRGPAVDYGAVLRSGWKLWRLALLYFVTFGGFVAMAVFLPKLLRDWFDISLTNAGLRAAGFTVVATFARPVGGFLSDRIGSATVLVVAFVGAGLDAAWLAHISSDPTWLPVTIACLTLAAFLGLGNGAVFKAVPLDFPEATGAATGIVGAAGGIGGFFPPVVMGIVKDHFDTYALGFIGLLVFALVCLVVALTMRRAARMPSEVTA
ncbi:MAG: MFS transporter [Gaiella sp.]|jgi:NNP family nitrate/nitrite transporter-like MFS transporter|uniref:MFS transporter n=1 Tax=Gaiella sp. TaxID=2663207 RepID=UPI003C6A2FBD